MRTTIQVSHDVPKATLGTATSTRFDKTAIHRLKLALGLPEFYKCQQGTKSTGIEALLVMLRRLSYPNRWNDLCPLFGRPEAELSMIFSEVLQVFEIVTAFLTCMHYTDCGRCLQQI